MAGQEHSSGAGQQSAATSDSAGDDSGLLSDIRSTWPWLSEASAKFLAQAIGAGRCPELGHQLRISAQGRGHKHNTPLSDVLVTVTSHSAFLRDFVDAFLSLLVEVQVRRAPRAPSPCSLRSCSFSVALPSAALFLLEALHRPHSSSRVAPRVGTASFVSLGSALPFVSSGAALVTRTMRAWTWGLIVRLETDHGG